MSSNRKRKRSACELSESSSVNDQPKRIDKNEKNTKDPDGSTSVNCTLTKSALKSLKTNLGIEYLDYYMEWNKITYMFVTNSENTEVQIKGLASDVKQIVEEINLLNVNPNLGEHVLKLTTAESNFLKQNMKILRSLKTVRNVFTRYNNNDNVEFKGGSTLAMLVSERRLMHKLYEEKLLKDEAQRKLDLEGCKVIKLRKEGYHNLLIHPYVHKLCEKHSINCKLEEGQVSLQGKKINIKMFLKETGSLRKRGNMGTGELLIKIDELLKLVDYTCETTKVVVEHLCETGQFKLLNCLIAKQQNGQIETLKRYREEYLKKIIVKSITYFNTQKFLKSFTRNKGIQFYLHRLCGIEPPKRNKSSVMDTFSLEASTSVDCKSITVTEKDALDLYSFGDPSDADINTAQECHHIEFTTENFNHLLNTLDGQDFLDELNNMCLMEIRKPESRLRLFCSESQRDDVKRSIDHYFSILQLGFPIVPNKIIDFLADNLARAKLDYYTVNCKQLYRQIQQENKHKSSYIIQLHGLLFSKYKLLDGQTHLDTVMHYMTIMSSRLSVTEMRRLKTAAMFLFSPVLMKDINYEWLVTLARPPNIPGIASLWNTCPRIMSSLKIGLFRLENEKDVNSVFKRHELEILQNYLVACEYNNRALCIANAFLQDNNHAYSARKT